MYNAEDNIMSYETKGNIIGNNKDWKSFKVHDIIKKDKYGADEGQDSQDVDIESTGGRKYHLTMGSDAWIGLKNEWTQKKKCEKKVQAWEKQQQPLREQWLLQQREQRWIQNQQRQQQMLGTVQQAPANLSSTKSWELKYEENIQFINTQIKEYNNNIKTQYMTKEVIPQHRGDFDTEYARWNHKATHFVGFTENFKKYLIDLRPELANAEVLNTLYNYNANTKDNTNNQLLPSVQCVKRAYELDKIKKKMAPILKKHNAIYLKLPHV